MGPRLSRIRHPLVFTSEVGKVLYVQDFIFRITYLPPYLTYLNLLCSIPVLSVFS